MVIDAVLKRYPLKPGEGVEAIKDLRTAYHAVAREGVTLDEVEARLVRMNDPRVVLALCVGANGFPPLYEQAFTGGAVDGQLDRAANFFVADPANVALDRGGNVLRLSPVFRDHAGLFLSGVLETLPGLDGIHAGREGGAVVHPAAHRPGRRRAPSSPPSRSSPTTTLTGR